MTTTGIVIANAPVSYGAFELTVGIDPMVPTALDVLDQVAAAGYSGIDLGPVGFLGRGTELHERLASRNLGLVGAYIELPYADRDGLDRALPALDELLDAFDEAGPNKDVPPPRPTLADAGSDTRRERPGRASSDHGVGLDAAGWRRFGAGLAEVVGRCRDRGYEPTFHHETGTYVEAPWEIERVLEVSDIGLCLDTGHFLLAGGDPVAAIGAWASRINHAHIKDARRSVMAGIVADGAPASAIWDREAFPALGQGDLDVDGVINALRRIGYGGWLVVEQDALPRTKERFERAATDQRANREYLTRRGL
ncbi:MAG: inosose dehydratase [Chloroflexota bacterium]|jgi:inosose dehydratase|nr:inosose dehydratase [Chloroflexota bacterium]